MDEDLERITCEGKQTGVTPDNPDLPMNLASNPDKSYGALAKAREMDVDAVLEQMELAGGNEEVCHLNDGAEVVKIGGVEDDDRVEVRRRCLAWISAESKDCMPTT